MTVRPELAEYVAHFRARVLQDALAEATGDYWRRRADAFSAVGTPECDQLAQLCRLHATLVPFPDGHDLAAATLREVD